MVEILTGLGVLVFGFTIIGILYSSLDTVLSILDGDNRNPSKLQIACFAIVVVPILIVLFWWAGTLLFELGHGILQGIGYYK